MAHRRCVLTQLQLLLRCAELHAVRKKKQDTNADRRRQISFRKNKSKTIQYFILEINYLNGRLVTSIHTHNNCCNCYYNSLRSQYVQGDFFFHRDPACIRKHESFLNGFFFFTQYYVNDIEFIKYIIYVFMETY